MLESTFAYRKLWHCIAVYLLNQMSTGVAAFSSIFGEREGVPGILKFAKNGC